MALNYSFSQTNKQNPQHDTFHLRKIIKRPLEINASLQIFHIQGWESIKMKKGKTLGYPSTITKLKSELCKLYKEVEIETPRKTEEAYSTPTVGPNTSNIWLRI